MVILSRKYVFTKDFINNHGPDVSGVFGLYDYLKFTIYYGKSDDNIKQELLKHLSGSEGRFTREAFYFNSEIGNDPDKRLQELLEEHKRIFEKLPEGNENPY